MEVKVTVVSTDNTVLDVMIVVGPELTEVELANAIREAIEHKLEVQED